MQKIPLLIVGQGLAGTLLSFELQKRDIDHRVISDQKSGASHVAAGMVNPLVFKRITKSWMADTLLPVMRNTYLELEQVLKTKLWYDKPIAKLINPDEKDWWNQRLESQQLHAYFDSFLPSNSISGIDSHFDLAILKQTGFVDLPEMLNTYTDYLLQKQQLISEPFNYSDIKLHQGNVLWNSYQADYLVFCEGAQAIENPWLPDSVFYLTKGDVLLVHIPGLSEEYILNKDVFVLPKGNQRFLIGSTYEHQFADNQPQQENADLLLKKARKFLNLPIQLEAHYAGIRPTVKDRRPLLGYHPQYIQLAFFNGLGTKGVMLGPYFAKQMAELLIQPDYAVLPDVALKRFFKT